MKEKIIEEYKNLRKKFPNTQITRDFFTHHTGISKHSIRKEFGSFGDFIKIANKEPDSRKTEFHQENKNNATAESIDPNVRTLEDLIKVCKINLDVWEVDRYVANKWEVAAKNESGELTNRPLYQIKAWLKRKETYKLKSIFEFYKNELNKIPPKPPQPKNYLQNASFVYEISIPDLHLAKLAWAQETGHTNYDINTAVSVYTDAFYYLAEMVNLTNVNKIILPIGNDFFNSEGLSGATTAGTRQDDDSRWQKSFKKGCSLITKLVDQYSQKVNIDIIIVSGNHDEERCFHLGEYLQAWYRNNNAVYINNSGTQRKYYNFGKNLLMWTHGNNEKHTDLPLIMARESKHFSSCEHFHVHLGHLHQDWLREYKGVKVRVLPSLCPPDAWHSNKGFIGNRQSAMGFLYDEEYGEIANFYYNI